jgi:hypothetical protein
VKFKNRSPSQQKGRVASSRSATLPSTQQRGTMNLSEHFRTAGDDLGSSIIELVRDPLDCSSLKLLLWTQSKVMTGSQIEFGNRTYEPLPVEPSVVRAVSWPTRPLKYKSTRALFEEVLSTITERVEMQERHARLLTYFVFSTWVPERLTLSPSIAILGPADGQGIRLLKVLRCLCRRSMLLADVSQPELLTLPLDLCPTLLMNRPVLGRRFAKFLSGTNRRGMCGVRAGKAIEVCCPKAIYFGDDRIPPCMLSATIQVALSPSPTRTTIIDAETLSELTASLQGKMLAYRLNSRSSIQISPLAGVLPASPSAEIAMNLAACIVNDSNLATAIASLMEEQDSRIRGERNLSFEAAIVTSVLLCLHEKKKNRIQVKEIAALANALLRTQGEIIEYTPEEVGHVLDVFSLWRIRQKDGMFLMLDRGTSKVVHQLVLQLAQAWNLDAASDCPDCQFLRMPESSLNSN